MNKKHKRTLDIKIDKTLLKKEDDTKEINQHADALTDICNYIADKELSTEVLLYAPFTNGSYGLATVKSYRSKEYQVPTETKAVIDILRALVSTSLKPVATDWIKEIGHGEYDEEKFFKDLFPYFYDTVTKHEFNLKKEKKNGRRRKH